MSEAKVESKAKGGGFCLSQAADSASVSAFKLALVVDIEPHVRAHVLRAHTDNHSRSGIHALRTAWGNLAHHAPDNSRCSCAHTDKNRSHHSSTTVYYTRRSTLSPLRLLARSLSPSFSPLLARSPLARPLSLSPTLPLVPSPSRVVSFSLPTCACCMAQVSASMLRARSTIPVRASLSLQV